MKLRAPGKNDHGASLHEFGLAILLFYVFVFGAIDFGRALYAYHFVSHAAWEATRYAIVHGAHSPHPATTANLAQYVKSITPGGINPKAVTVSATWTPNHSVGSNVRVQVQDDFRFVMPLLPKARLTLSSASQMVIPQ